MSIEKRMVLDFSQADAHIPWQVINDGVMGGISQAEMVFTGTGSGLFQGTVSLENNGGFASVRQSVTAHDLSRYSGLRLQVTGDGRTYQLRLRTDDRYDGSSYRYRFTTQAGKPITVSAPFTDFEPVLRGRIVSDSEPLDPSEIKQIGFLIADKQAGSFALEIDWIQAY